MRTACVLFRPTGGYRRAEFSDGLARCGFHIVQQPMRTPEPGDVLLLWNRLSMYEAYAQAYERAGGTVIVAENGYIEGSDGEKQYALAIGHHNGAGTFHVGGPERLAGLGLELLPWRPAGDQVVLLPQRGIGCRGVAQPAGWANVQIQGLKQRTARTVTLRPHPGHLKTEPYAALTGAHAAVTWGSGAAIKALAFGIPVFHGFTQWIGAPAGLQLDGANLEAPKLDDEARLAMFQRLAWAQWSMGEIVSGEAFSWLLSS